MMNSFDHMALILSDYNKSTSKFTGIVSENEYNIFLQEMTLYYAAGEDFGKCFCKKFGISDYVLNMMHDTEHAKRWIKTLGYVKT